MSVQLRIFDFVFLLDKGSGSIQTDAFGGFLDELENLRKKEQPYEGRNGFKSFIRIGNWRGKVIAFSDVDPDGSAWFQDQPFVMNDPVSFREQFDQIQMTSESENPSSALDAIHKVAAGALRASASQESRNYWTPHATRHIILISDRPCKEAMTYKKGTGGDVHDVADLITKERIQLGIIAPDLECFEKLSIIDKSQWHCPDGGSSVAPVLENILRMLPNELMWMGASPEFSYYTNSGWLSDNRV